MAIRRYGIYNPYAGRGAIKGLLLHGLHNFRDILATHVLGQAGPESRHATPSGRTPPHVVQQRYGRFLPQDRAALVAKVNQVRTAA